MQPTAQQPPTQQAPLQQPPQQWPGGGAPQQPGYGGYYGGQEPPQKSKPPIVLLTVIGVLVVAIIVAIVILVTHKSNPTPPPPTVPTATAPVVPPATSDVGSGYRDPSGQVTASADVNPSDLQVGDCIENISDTGDSVDTLAVIPCSTPHEGEVYAVTPSIVNDKPTIQAFCSDAFQPFVGIDFQQSILQVTYIRSNSGTNTDVQCIVYDPGQLVTQSYKGSQK